VTSTQASDDADALRAARDDLRHFAPVYERYFPRVYAYCVRRVGATEAEDLTSQIFTNAMLHLHQYRGGLAAAWLFRIAHNVVVNHLKQARRAPLSLDDESRLASGAPAPVDRVIQAEEEHAIRALVEKLPHDQQDMLLLRVVGGLSAAEIGVLVGKNAGAVRVAIYRTLRHLQQSYQKGEHRYGELSTE
jgi:RNA polymerase sigma-70 factor, ECF subfamily